MSNTPADETRPADDAAEAPEQELTWAGNVPLTKRWWWHGALWIILGGGVVAYQSPVLLGGEPLALTWVMVALGLVVVGAGVVELIRSRPRES